jgi:hypothetical protein
LASLLSQEGLPNLSAFSRVVHFSLPFLVHFCITGDKRAARSFIVCSPRIASKATLALNSAEKRLRLVLLMGVILLRQVQAFHLNTLSEFWGPPLFAELQKRKSKMRTNVIIILLFGVFSTLLPMVARGQTSDESIVKDLQKLRVMFHPNLNTQERAIENKIKIIAPNTLPFAHVGADIDKQTGDRIISFNYGSYIRFLYLAKALYISTMVIKDDKYLFGYMRYLAFADSFKADELFSPIRYYQYYENKDLTKEIEKLPKEIRELENFFPTNIVGFILAHEIAHHIYNDPSNPDQAPKARRDREARADKWAANQMAEAKQIPIFAVFSLLLFNELDERSSQNEFASVHPAGIARAAQLTQYTLTHLKYNELKFRKLLSGSSYQYEQLLSGIEGINKLIKQKAEFQDKTYENPKKKWIYLAANGDLFAQLRVAEYVAPKEKDEDEPGFVDPDALESWLFWLKQAADNSSKFDYVDSAIAEYQIGYIYAFRKGVKKDYDQACKYLKRSADKGYYPGISAYDKLRENTMCNQ